MITHLFSKTKQKHLCEQTQKAMYGIIRKISQFDLFDKVVVPVIHVLFGFEVWGYEKLDVVERIHLNFLCPIENFCNCRSVYRQSVVRSISFDSLL